MSKYFAKLFQKVSRWLTKNNLPYNYVTTAVSSPVLFLVAA